MPFCLPFVPSHLMKLQIKMSLKDFSPKIYTFSNSLANTTKWEGFYAGILPWVATDYILQHWSLQMTHTMTLWGELSLIKITSYNNIIYTAPSFQMFWKHPIKVSFLMCNWLRGKLGSDLTAGHHIETGSEERGSQQKLQSIQCNYLI